MPAWTRIIRRVLIFCSDNSSRKIPRSVNFEKKEFSSNPRVPGRNVVLLQIAEFQSVERAIFRNFPFSWAYYEAVSRCNFRVSPDGVGRKQVRGIQDPLRLVL